MIDKDEFYEFFELENFYDKKHKIPPKIERVLKIKKLLYHNGEISEDITNSFLKYAFEEQIGNKLLLVTYIAKEKIQLKGFLKKLEKNYGIYLDVDDFIKEMKKKLNEIKSYKQLFEYIGGEFGKNKNDLELIREAYEKAKLKRYVENYRKKKKKEKKENKDKKEKKATINFNDDDEEYYEDNNEYDDYDEDDDEGGEEEEDE